MTTPLRVALTQRVGFVATFALAALVLPDAARGQSLANGFYFAQPRFQVSLHGGFAHANAGSRIFSFATQQLTLNRNDFSGLAGSLEYAARVSPTADVTFEAGYSGTTNRSEFRDWVDQDALPIEQTTQFMRVPVTLGLKVYPLARGRLIGQLAWIPSRVVPYIGAGVGMMKYQFDQQGDFIDYADLHVFSDHFVASAWTPMAQASAGADVSLGMRFGVTTSVKQVWAKGQLNDSFVGFDKIDLSGLTATAGLFIRF
jgi:outer membrane protein W